MLPSLKRGNDIGSGFEKLIGSFLGIFDGEKKPKSTMRTVYKKADATPRKSLPK
jgi:hypothetical protein